MTPIAGWITAISVLVIALVMTVGLVVAVVMVKKYVSRLLNAADPAMKQAEITLKRVGGIAETVKTRTDEISATVEDTVEDVSRRVRSTTSVIQQAVSPPFVGMASMLAGLSRGLQVWSELSRRKGGDTRG